MDNTHTSSIIIGGGASGLFAALSAKSKSGKTPLVLEKMDKPGTKLSITGKGRCNITNNASMDEFINHFSGGKKFLKTVFYQYFSEKLLNDLKGIGVEAKLERGGRYFPKEDSAVKFVKAILNDIKQKNIPIKTGYEVLNIEKVDGLYRITCKNPSRVEEIFLTEKVLIATGGLSYPKTGSNGDGLKLAFNLGHRTVDCRPSLVPFRIKEDLTKLEGLQLKNVKAEIRIEGKKQWEEFGELYFIHKRISGPIALTLSHKINRTFDLDKNYQIIIDLKPALTHQQIDKRLLREVKECHGTVKKLLQSLLPLRLVDFFIEQLTLSPEKPLHQLSGVERKKIRLHLKEWTFHVTGLGGFNEAIVTSGGVDLKEINPATMESKIHKNLYFAGEVLNIDADTGGFNLQAAFSTGWIAGQQISS